MILSPEDKSAIYIVMSTLLPENGVDSLDMNDTYLLRERVAAVQAEVEFFRIQVENHLAELNSRYQPKVSKHTADPLATRIAKLLNGKNLDKLLSEIDKMESA